MTEKLSKISNDSTSVLLDAVKELTKEIAAIKKEVKEFREELKLKMKAGKF